jgi:hypothetical protein
VTLTAMSLVIVTLAVLLFEGSATLVAVTDTVAGCGKFAGAVKFPLAETVPVVELPPATPFTDHATAVFDVFVTVALNCIALPSGTDTLVGATETVTGGGGGGGPPPTPAHPVRAIARSPQSAHTQ